MCPLVFLIAMIRNSLRPLLTTNLLKAVDDKAAAVVESGKSRDAKALA